MKSFYFIVIDMPYGLKFVIDIPYDRNDAAHAYYCCPYKSVSNNISHV
jgi:hypothetical protein